MITSEEIKRRLWNGANELRGSMDASRYKDYMLGLMFYKFLSDKTLDQFKIVSGAQGVTKEELAKEYLETIKEYGDEAESVYTTIQQVLGYYVKPEYLYQTWLKDINTGDFEVQKVTDSLNIFESSITSNDDADDFKGLFANSTLDLSDTALGSNLKERSDNIKNLILLFADLDMVDLQKGDILGDAYEYLIGQFAMESGKKAGEFYTPRQVSEVMAQIVSKSSQIKSIYDPAVGSGSLLLTVGKHLSADNQKNLNYFGQEKNTATYNLTRMNLLLHGVRPERMTVKNADTLAQDWPEDPQRPNEGVQFDAVVMNPPYSLKNWNRAGIKVSDPRFEIAGVLPPDSKGDYAFLLHGLFHLGQSGTMAIVLPHGVLFRGSAEGEIRKRLLEKNYIDAIIGLPSGMFTNTSIPVIIMILKKNRNIGDSVLIIDSSKDFIKVGKQNSLQEKDIAKIVDAYVNKAEIKGYSHLASRQEIMSNDYNLNIPRYVESNDADIPHDVDAHLYGGIPQYNIDDLSALNEMVPDVLNKSLVKVREGYVKLNKSIDDLTSDILNDASIKNITNEIKTAVDQYINQYWDILRNTNKETNIVELMNDMLSSMKSLLMKYKYIDVYDGYQVIAEIWKESLMHDIEIISLEGFYEAGRTKVPHMITKGSGKNRHEEQDGWLGTIIPNEMISNTLFINDQKQIESYRNQIQDCESRISELLEDAKNEESSDSSFLSEILNDSNDAFDTKLLKIKLKETDKTTQDYKLLKEVEDLFSTKSTMNKKIKVSEKELSDNVQNSIDSLTNEEIDTIMFNKWFGSVENSMLELITSQVKRDLDILKMLDERYSDTLESLDLEMKELEESINLLTSELVVTS